MFQKTITLVLCLLLALSPVFSQKKKQADKHDAKTEDTLSLEDISLSGLSFRSIGPAVTGGRVIDIEVNPNDHSEYFVASGHGSLWKTTNNGVTFSPAFDGQSSFAIGSVTMDPTNPNVVWVGTGENNAQANVIYGDGIYKSEDGGKTWENKGLKESQHIGGIVVDPNDPDIVLVAAYGPQRESGGERGVYRTQDGGETWEHVLNISEHTGCWQIHMDPRYLNIIYAVAHQRQRRLYTGVYGGPESGIYRSTDGGTTWEKLKGGLPTESVGRIGLAISPVDPDIVYAVVEAAENQGFYKSTDRGSSWTKQSSYVTSYGFYLQKIVCDPVEVDRVYALDIFMQVTEDGGKTWKNAGEKYKHVDNHTLWIDPDDNRHLLSGCDGGVYETFDRCENWLFKANIPITEIYKVTVDNAKPFYNVYIGTQDNNSLGGPSRTINSGGISNADWVFTWGGDGFETQVDWKDPNILYSQSQFGGLVRFDKRTGERLYIKPYEEGDTAYRFDWDAALLLSSHDNHRLYFAGNILLRSDDQGSTWEEISGDLTRGFPKEMLPLMGRTWSIDELARIGSMAQIVTIAESQLDENILYTGSGDGLIHYTHDGGQTWSKGKAPGLPEYARVHHIVASHHDKNVAYAACQNFLAGDFKPYLFKTSDGGATWKNISSNLPERGSTYTVGEDHEDPDLLFVGTQFGIFVSNTPEFHWLKLSAGLPTATVMDLDLQRHENDLVVSTFGRGVYILDDYSPLRSLDTALIRNEVALLPVPDAEMFVEADPFGFPGVGFQGSAYYVAPNPEVGAVFTWYVREKPKTLKEQRREKEKKLVKEDGVIKYPSYERLKNESEEIEPYLLFTVRDADGNIVRRMKKDVSAGVQRIIWDFKTSPPAPVSLEAFDNSIPWASPDLGYMVVPGEYSVSLSMFDGDTLKEIADPQIFECKPLHERDLTQEEITFLESFNRKVYELSRAMSGVDAHRSHLADNLPYLKKATMGAPDAPASIHVRLLEIEQALDDLNKTINGDNLRSKFEGASPTSLKDRVDLITGSLWSTTATPTSTFERAYDEAAANFEEVMDELKQIEAQISKVEDQLEESGAPYTPGRFPVWRR